MGHKTVGNSAQYVRMAEPVFLCFAEDLLLLRLGICSNVQQVLWRILFKTVCRQRRCFGLRGNVREEINIDSVADAPSGVLKIALHLMSRPPPVLRCITHVTGSCKGANCLLLQVSSYGLLARLGIYSRRPQPYGSFEQTGKCAVLDSESFPNMGIWFR